MNLLIPYVYLYDHNDPLFKEFTYGDVGARAAQLKNNLRKGDHVFFHRSIAGKKYITAYYLVDRVLNTSEAVKDRNIVTKYKNPHLERQPSKHERYNGDVILFGDPITSRVLDRPLLFDKTLAKKLSLNIKFPDGKTETQAIGSATRAWRKLTDKDVEVLKKAISVSEKEGLNIEKIYSTDEVTEFIEKDIENFIEKNPAIIGSSLKLKRRQLDTPVGRTDLIFENEIGGLLVVELKLNKIGRDAITQLRRYMDWVKQETKKEVGGAVICKGVMPVFKEDIKKLKNIKIFCYGWQLNVYPWSGAE